MGNLRRTGLLSRGGAREDSVRVGLVARASLGGREARGPLLAVSDLGRVESRLAIPVRVPNSLGITVLGRLGPASSDSAAGLSSCTARRGNALREGVCVTAGADLIARGVDVVGSRRYRARLRIRFVNVVSWLSK